MKPQALSKTDSYCLRSGVCPSCNKTRFIMVNYASALLNGCVTGVLCLHCQREFAVLAPPNPSFIIHFLCPLERQAEFYTIHHGPIPTK